MPTNHFDIAAFCDRMEDYLGNQEGEAKLFWKAFSFAVEAHQYQKRKSGEAYVSHPCLVAQILVEELGVTDPETLAAAVLHDTVEDVEEVTSELIGELFGKHVEAIVDGCTKISHFSGDRQTFYRLVHRKLFSGAASRIEIMLVKLADRLHNLRTMAAMPKHKRQKIADETLGVYAPMAGVMGLFGLKRELYDLALSYKFPKQSQRVLYSIRKLETLDEVLSIREKLQEELNRVWLSSEVRIKAKGLWAYYNIGLKTLSREIENPMEMIIVVEDVQSCYRALGIINQHFPPIPRTIRDFIANPKPTAYQSLHARANIKGQNYLFKIRTRPMMTSARNGIIRRWLTKGTVPSGFAQEIREMFTILGADDSLSYHDVIEASGKKEIYTYTPNGDRICLPVQSIVLDFAFKVHTEIGSHCTHAMVRNKRVGVDHILQDGDRIKIITQKKPVRFEPSILKLCQSPRARATLSRTFRQHRLGLAAIVGQSIMREELRRYGIPFEILEKEEMADILEYFNLKDINELFQALGQGRLRLRELIYEVKNGLYADRVTLQPPTGAFNMIDLDILDPDCIKLSRCCNPIPTEKRLHALLSERGLSVHRKDCPKFKSLRLQREDVVQVRWQLKKTRVKKNQTLHILKNFERNRVFMLLSVAPVEMKIIDIISLAKRASATTAWEVNFQVDNLLELKHVLQHFTKTKIEYEFVLEQ
ncbi:MAG: HD domain-containing protein [Thermodesulfobacteriota bacterium]|nr:HD domain-containing protein [Thermodesulfobacteriota bacterium]